MPAFSETFVDESEKINQYNTKSKHQIVDIDGYYKITSNARIKTHNNRKRWASKRRHQRNVAERRPDARVWVEGPSPY